MGNKNKLQIANTSVHFGESLKNALFKGNSPFLIKYSFFHLAKNHTFVDNIIETQPLDVRKTINISL